MSVSISGAGSISGLDQGFNVTTGSVGIGTDNPTQKLELLSTGNTIVKLGGGSANTTGIIINRGGSEVSRISHSNSDDLSFYTTSSVTERLRITSDGDVGIGTDNPQSLLSLYQSGGGFEVNANSGSNNARLLSYDRPAGVYREMTFQALSYVSSGSGTERLRITSGGGVGIGTDIPYVNNSFTSLSVGGSGKYGLIELNKSDGVAGSWIDVYGTNGNGDLRITTAGTSGAITFWTGGSFTEKLRITSDGRLCINSTSPVQVGGQTPYLYVSSYTNLDGLRIRGLDTGNTLWKTGGDMSLSVASNDAINLKTNGTTRFVLNANSNNSTTLSIGNGSNLTNNTSPDRTSVKVGGTLHLESPFSGPNHRTGMYYNCYASGQSNFYQGTFGASAQDYRAAAATLRSGAFQVYTDPITSTNYSAGAQITTMKETLTCSNGFVTAPNQPCFWATSNTGGSHTSNGYTGIISNQFEAAYVNVGNHFNTSTGVFTCPVAGTYEFHGQGLARQQGGDGNMELAFYKNGSITISRSHGYTYVKTQSDHDNLHVMAYITCAANDQIDLRVYAMASGVDCYWAQGLGYFAGRLVQ